MSRPLGLLAIVLTVNIATLTGLAHATPPDQTWIGGLYDNADYDDVILRATWTASTPAYSLLLALELSPVFLDLVSRADPATIAHPDARRSRPRGPPSVQ